MKLDGRRESENFEDRRGMSGGQMAGLGIGGMIIVGLITLLMGGNPLEVVQQMGGKINIKSEVGKGTIVWVTIPCYCSEIVRK